MVEHSESQVCVLCAAKTYDIPLKAMVYVINNVSVDEAIKIYAQHRDQSDAGSKFIQLNCSVGYTYTCNISKCTLKDDKI